MVPPEGEEKASIAWILVPLASLHKCVKMTHMELFGWFRRNRDKVETPSDINDRVYELERAMKNIRLEWDDTYESVARLVRKLSKREKRALQEEGTEAEVTPAPVPPNGDLHALRAQARLRGIRV